MTKKRKPITKKSRFEVFKRDSFCCQYCGSKPPSVVLEIDHINPVFLGGTNDLDNLITACFDCNRGKGARKLDSAPDSITDKLEIKKEKQEQLRALEKLMSREKAKITRRVNDLNWRFYDLSGCEFSDSFKVSCREFFKMLERSEVFDAMDIALSRISDPEQALKYFCGVCWRKIEASKNG